MDPANPQGMIAPYPKQLGAEVQLNSNFMQGGKVPMTYLQAACFSSKSNSQPIQSFAL